VAIQRPGRTTEPLGPFRPLATRLSAHSADSLTVLTIRSHGLDAIIAEVDRLSKAPSERTIARLDASLQVAYDESESQIHLLTGRTRESGETNSSSHRGEWVGELRYGGELAPMWNSSSGRILTS
jgi:hypothetical protein